jgi:hypothetical protein
MTTPSEAEYNLGLRYKYEFDWQRSHCWPTGSASGRQRDCSPRELGLDAS